MHNEDLTFDPWSSWIGPWLNVVARNGGAALRHSKAVIVIVIGACVVLALLTVFSIELSDTQAKSKSGIEVEVHQRAQLAEALIASLFQTVQQQVPQDTQTYGAPSVSNQTMDKQEGTQKGYLALIGSDGKVLASSSGFTAQARAELPRSAALALVRSGRPYGLGQPVTVRDDRRDRLRGALPHARGHPDPPHRIHSRRTQFVHRG